MLVVGSLSGLRRGRLGSERSGAWVRGSAVVVQARLEPTVEPWSGCGRTWRTGRGRVVAGLGCLVG